MNTRLRICLLTICSCFVLLHNTACAQEVTYSSPSNFYWNPFETGSAASLNTLSNYQSGFHSVISSNTLTPLNGSYSAQSVNNQVNSPANGGIYGSIIPSGTSLSSGTYVFSFLYKFTGSTTNIVDYGTPVSKNNAGWRFWVITNSTTPTASGGKGFYFTQVGNTLKLISMAGYTRDCGLNYTMTAGRTYNIIFKMINGGTFVVYVDDVTASPGTLTATDSQLQTNFGDGLTTYNYSVLECNDARNAANGNFQWDDYKFFQATETMSQVAFTPSSTSIVAGQTGVIAYEYSITVRDVMNIKTNSGNGGLVINNPNTAQSTYLSGSNLYEGPDNTFADASLVSASSITNMYSAIQNTSAINLSSTSQNGTTYYFFVTLNISSSIPTPYTFQPLNNPSVGYDNYNGYLNFLSVTGTGPTFTVANVYDWIGGNPTSGIYLWTTPANWKLNGSTSSTYPGQNASTDVANIGVNYTYTGEPTLNTNLPNNVGSIFIGPGGTSSQGSTTIGSFPFYYTEMIYHPVTLTVNNTSGGTAVTLTTGAFAINHPGGISNTFSTFGTTIKGTGTLTDNGDFNMGNSTVPTYVNSTTLSTTITQFNIKGNLILNSVGTTSGSGKINFPYFSLDQNKLSLTGQIKYTATGTPDNTYISNENSYYQTNGMYTMDDVSGNTCTLELLNANPVAVPSTSCTVDFDNYGYGGTIIYDDPTSSDVQFVYTTNSAGTGVNPANYNNLTLSGASQKRTDGGALTVYNNWNTSGGAVDLSTNNPTITTTTSTGAWTNATTVTQGSGSITIAGSVVNNSGGKLALGSGGLNIAGNYTNNLGGIYSQSTGVTTFNGGSGTTQTLTDNSTTGTTFTNVVFDGPGTLTVTMAAGTGNFGVSSTGILTMGSNTTLNAGTIPTSATTAGTGYLTLLSDATGTGTILAIPSSAVINGYVNVQRYVTGTNAYRSYRLFSSPVNATSATASTASTGNANVISFNSLNYTGTYGGTSYYGAYTAGPGTTGLSAFNRNPTVYLYDEMLDPATASKNSSFTSGKNIGISSVASGTNGTQLNLVSSIATFSATSVPVANGYLVFFIGSTNGRSTSSPEGTVADNATITQSGFINQQSFYAKMWYATSPSNSGTLTKGSTITANFPGYNMVGNPYPCTIDLVQLWNDNLFSGLSSTFYELNDGPSNSNYVGYNGSTNAASTTNSPTGRASRYIASGQGFFAVATSSGQRLAFKEDQKTTTNTNPSPLLLNATPPNSNPAAKTPVQSRSLAVQPSQFKELTGLHLQLFQDSVHYDECGVYFGDYSDNFESVDGRDMDGVSPTVFLSSYTADNVRTCINMLSSYIPGKRVKLFVKANTDGIYKLNLEDIANVDTVNYRVFLIDKKLNDSLDMVHYKSYTFNFSAADTSSFTNRFVLAVEPISLAPYSLITLTGQKGKDNTILLNWKTANEGVYTTFGLEKLGANGLYTTIDSLQSNGSGAYSYNDPNPVTGNNIYRLAENDIHGKVTYAGPVNINYSATSASGLFTIYPNPSKDIINIIVNTGVTGNQPTQTYIANIYNLAGNIMNNRQVNSNSWTQDVTSYKAGVYILELKTADGNVVGKAKFVKTN